MQPADILLSFPGAVTVCDVNGIITYMNDRAAVNYAKDGGRALVGKDLLACHSEPAASELRDMLANPRLNVYTTERRGVKKLVYQTPLYQDDSFAGIGELILELPPDMRHFDRNR
jgi:hypothetical protein